LQRLLVAEHLVRMLQDGDLDSGGSWPVIAASQQLGTESALLERAAREQLGSPDSTRRSVALMLLQALPSVSERTYSSLEHLLLVEETPRVIGGALGLYARRSRAPGKAALLHAGRCVGREEARMLCRVATYLADGVTDMLAEFCNSENQDLVSAAAARVPDFGSSCAAGTPGLLRLLGSEDEIDRARACQALDSVGPGARSAVSALDHALKTDADGAVRMYACEALASIARDEPDLVVEALGDALSDPSRAVRIAGAKGLWQLGKGAAPAEIQIRASLNDYDDEVVRWARRALKTLEDH